MKLSAIFIIFKNFSSHLQINGRRKKNLPLQRNVQMNLKIGLSDTYMLPFIFVLNKRAPYVDIELETSHIIIIRFEGALINRLESQLLTFSNHSFQLLASEIIYRWDSITQDVRRNGCECVEQERKMWKYEFPGFTVKHLSPPFPFFLFYFFFLDLRGLIARLQNKVARYDY